MTATIHPHNVDAERALLGVLMEAPQLADSCGVAPSDLDPALGHPHILGAILGLFEAKGTAEPMLVLDELNRRDQTSRIGEGQHRGALYLSQLVGEARRPGSVGYYARLVRESSYRRNLHTIGHLLAQAAAATGDIDAVLDRAQDLSLQLGMVVDAPLEGDGPIPGLSSVDEFVREPSPPHNWVIPGVVERADRVMVVAGEGVGKSVLARQVCTLLAAGRHPFMPKQAIRPRRTLLLDLENPPDLVRRGLRGLVGQVWDEGLDVGDRAWRWNRPGGMDLRSQADRALLARVIEKVRPDLIAIGPLYKASLPRAGDTYEVAAAEVGAAIDHLRERFGVAFWIEHHMPKGETSGQRYGPIGSSFWMRWPEFGLTIRRDPDAEGRVFNLDRFRGDRDERCWPDQLMKGVTKWPWTAAFNDSEVENQLYEVIDADHAEYLADQRIRREQTGYTTPPATSARGGASEPSDEAANLSQDPIPPTSACRLPDPEDQDG